MSLNVSKSEIIFHSLEKLPLFSKLVKEINDNKNEIFVKTLSGSLASVFCHKLHELSQRQFFIITTDNEKAEDWYHDLKLFNDESDLSVIKEPKYSFRGKIENQSEQIDWLIEGLTKNLADINSLIVINQTLLNVRVPAPQGIIDKYISVKAEQSINFDDFTKGLMLNGFERKDYVASQGEIAIRGGIVDLFPIAWDNPIRIEFWGDQIESIREFDRISQRSIKEHKEVEFIGGLFGMDSNDDFTVFDYLAENCLIINDGIISEILDESVKEKYDSFQKLNINQFDKADFNFSSFLQPSFNISVKKLAHEIAKHNYSGFKIFVSADGKIHLDRIKELIERSINELTDNELEYTVDKNKLFNSIYWLSETFSSGFISNDLRIAVFTEHQIFDRTRVKDLGKAKKSKGITLKEIQDLRIGEYVVHEDKGIGLFEGFKTVQMGGSNQDCVKLKFAGDDVLYVSLNYINKISKYSANEDAKPVLSKLGSPEWAKKKAKAKGKLKDIARNLIVLYAKRKAIPGYAFPADDLWQKEFEASFIYEDTPDQARATSEIKVDMESSSPMDRLVCGDVGFGKTEVAIRAAFKAAQSGKQVAVLVPTTILAQQHYMSFKDRFHNYPVNVDVISRFRSPRQQKEIIENTKAGKIDILIGTHRILSKDIIFKDLGLLVVDEEHRFGVAAKEKLRALRASIDTLTLTATPIPRTLNFSLMGARDLSVMETPPRNRTPVMTQIVEWDNDFIASAIENEVKRGGQIFFVSDKVHDLDKISVDLQKLVPNLRIATAHGQLPPHQLETIMEGFIEGKFDILLATKIIESGIDIPNANTIFINRAQNFGLAELYQLRGRVGRTNKQAFCYLLIPTTYKLNNMAVRRLQAIEEFTELGSGLQLAMRDLEIRGAGNLLGAEQSGFIIDIGFELFQKILDEAVTELKNEEFADVFGIKEEDIKPKFSNEDIQIELDVDALFPTDFIPNETDRFIFYKKLYKVKDYKELNDIVNEIQDRYGKLPRPARNLIYAVKVRIAAIETGFVKIIIKSDKMICEFPPQDKNDYYEKAFPLVIDYVTDLPNVKLNQTKTKLLLEADIESKDQVIEILWKIKKTIEYV